MFLQCEETLLSVSQPQTPCFISGVIKESSYLYSEAIRWLKVTLEILSDVHFAFTVEKFDWRGFDFSNYMGKVTAILWQLLRLQDTKTSSFPSLHDCWDIVICVQGKDTQIRFSFIILDWSFLKISWASCYHIDLLSPFCNLTWSNPSKYDAISCLIAQKRNHSEASL